MTYAEILKGVQDSIKGLMAKDGISDEQLDGLASINKQVEELDKQHQELATKYGSMRDKYIEAITNYGTNEANKGSEEAKKPRTLEEIAKAVAEKRTKK